MFLTINFWNMDYDHIVKCTKYERSQSIDVIVATWHTLCIFWNQFRLCPSRQQTQTLGGLFHVGRSKGDCVIDESLDSVPVSLVYIVLLRRRGRTGERQQTWKKDEDTFIIAFLLKARSAVRVVVSIRGPCDSFL